MVSEPGENRENQGAQPRAGGFRKVRRGQLARTAGSSCQTEAGQGMLARAQEAMVTRYLAASVTQTKPGSQGWQRNSAKGVGARSKGSALQKGTKETDTRLSEASVRTVISIKWQKLGRVVYAYSPITQESKERGL